MKNNLRNMICLDIYLSSLSEKEYQKAIQYIDRPTTESAPLLSWDIFKNGYDRKMAETLRHHELKQVLSFARQYHWKNDLEATFEETDYEALIITDHRQNIIWVNDGFSEMTGYSKRFALNKTPRFLQGEMTSSATKSRIREQIAANKPFKDVIVNHRKDNSTYTCEVKIVPLYNEHTTHFIAFEKQVV
ncbi:PAS domain-containing protein [Jiulongibacter sp. NS-SX5]|uniref:PAS domain-containing protein n=1 Tax=Jiulongibacter sp. NS-SX5 TaxID=3463854 RepID=UPI004059A17F